MSAITKPSSNDPKEQPQKNPDTKITVENCNIAYTALSMIKDVADSHALYNVIDSRLKAYFKAEEQKPQ